MTILLPIIKTFCDKIFSGEKRYEYRKALPKNGVDRVIVYESRGIGMVVGEFEVTGILKDSPSEVWDKTKENSGVSESDFFSYFRNRALAFALEIGNYRRYHNPIPLSEYGIKRAPQNFIYLKNS